MTGTPTNPNTITLVAPDQAAPALEFLIRKINRDVPIIADPATRSYRATISIPPGEDDIRWVLGNLIHRMSDIIGEHSRAGEVVRAVEATRAGFRTSEKGWAAGFHKAYRNGLVCVKHGTTN